MKLLVATFDTQGAAPTDHCSVPAGELVVPDGDVFVGVNTGRSTTTAKVVERTVPAAVVRGQAERLASMLRCVPVGAVVERQGCGVWPRRTDARVGVAP